MFLYLRAATTLAVFFSIDASIYLYHTQDGTGVEFFDCVYAQSLWYCRRPTEPENLMRDKDASTCERNGGIAHRFSDLRTNGTNVSTILHRWQSSIERVEQYVHFLRDDSQTDGYLCQCLNRWSFGKSCEYQLFEGQTFSETVERQRVIRKHVAWMIPGYGDISCYPTLTCDSGLLCLDWREICDGIQHCTYGHDEENCDLLELNTCDDDEYRCMNGMCIPAGYFLDGQFDCLDWSDEIQYMKSDDCPFETGTIRCDDHVCPPHQWSCGDGQCIPDRLGFHKAREYPACVNQRDFHFTCEAKVDPTDWTKPDGRCWVMGDNAWNAIELETIEDECDYVFRCILSKGKHDGCWCITPSYCQTRFGELCPPSLVPYPRQPLFTPYMVFLYERYPDKRENPPSMMSINGTIKCRNAFLPVHTTLPYYPNITIRHLMNDLCFSYVSNQSSRCQNEKESTDVCQEWNPCMSRTRLSDGIVNCLNGRDETERSTSCDQRYRFRCSSEQPTCLSVTTLGNQENNCDNWRDEFLFGYKKSLAEMKCNDQDESECFLIRRYIQQSWTLSQSYQMASSHRIAFRSYCDTFWDLETGEDENLTDCQQWWICASDQYRCRSGQCYNRSWGIDGEWDCSDGSDEIDLFSLRIGRIQLGAERLKISQDTFHLSAKHCDKDKSFVCLSPQTSHPHFRCLNLSQLGDNVIDCAGGVDEPNTLRQCSRSRMLGDHFKCPSDNTCIPHAHHCRDGHRCPHRTDDAHWCSWQAKLGRCDEKKDFVCFNEKCIIRGRCNGLLECLYGEDEYLCEYTVSPETEKSQYRQAKYSRMESLPRIFTLKSVPLELNLPKLSPPYQLLHRMTESLGDGEPMESWLHSWPFKCNRGIKVIFNNDSSFCFCPPQYYGERCQYHADRLLVLLHLRLHQSVGGIHHEQNIVITLLVLFLHNGQTLMTHEFHVRPAMETNKFTKKMIHFLYSHSKTSQQQRRRRYLNRSDIITSQPYSIHIEAYRCTDSSLPSLLAVWRYPIQFDYLPVYRWAKELHLKRSTSDDKLCGKELCHRNEECHRLMNNPIEHICLCRTNFTGPNCSQVSEQCLTGYCAPGALCKPNYRGSLRDTSVPYCVCPANRFGVHCELEYDACRSNPCLNNGTCFPSVQLNEAVCLCTESYYGNRCGLRKASINLTLEINRTYAGATIQFFDYDPASLILKLDHQQVHQILPRLIQYQRSAPTIPPMVFASLYSSFNDRWPDVYLLMVQINDQSVNARTEISETTRCPHVGTLLPEPSLFQYHHVCRNNSRLLCFHDDIYFCICADNQTRVECFLYDDQMNQCHHCQFGGRCLQGDPNRRHDFICLCPPCHSGIQCQFSSRSFTFTLDQLLYTNLISTHYRTTTALLIILSLLCFALGIPNNLFCFVTFRQRSCLHHGIGQYLFCLSIINQISLGLLVARVLHIIHHLTTNGTSTAASTGDNILCKVMNYLLLSSSRMVFWLSSLVAIERLYTTLFVHRQWLRQPYVARRLITLFVLAILLLNSYELLFYRSFLLVNANNRQICMFELPSTHQSFWMILHVLINALNSLLPFFINLISVITISVIVVRNRMKTLRAKKKYGGSDQSRWMNVRYRLRFIIDVLSENKVLVLGPAITLIPQLFSLPLFLSAFTLVCRDIENSWIRYLLLCCYFVSFTPQLISFVLYISPSTFYLSEWRKTKVSQWMKIMRHRFSLKRETATRTD